MDYLKTWLKQTYPLFDIGEDLAELDGNDLISFEDWIKDKILEDYNNFLNSNYNNSGYDQSDIDQFLKQTN